jgi:hypothetical protein
MTPRPSYTRAEAYALEAHYIACAMREGIWGKGRPPGSLADKISAQEAGMRSCVVRQARSEEKKRDVLQAVRDGHETAMKIKTLLSLSDTCVRKYLCELRDKGLIEEVRRCQFGGRTWRAVEDDDSNVAS